jgi:hypothetical protein
MMFYEEIVAVLCDTNKKPLRELDSQKQENGRKTKVFLPFDSEYKILIKNNSDRRIKLNIEIDGTSVSGNGLILSAHQTDYIERFVDIARKFKFVKSSNENVADPTNLENGVIKIRIHKEKPINLTPITIHHYGYGYDVWNNRTIGGVLRGTTTDMSYSAGAQTYSLNCSCSNLESGATIEGGKSEQTFTSTYWNGNEDKEIVFTFHLFGSEQNDQEKLQKMEQFLKLKKELGL